MIFKCTQSQNSYYTMLFHLSVRNLRVMWSHDAGSEELVTANNPHESTIHCQANNKQRTDKVRDQLVKKENFLPDIFLRSYWLYLLGVGYVRYNNFKRWKRVMALLGPLTSSNRLHTSLEAQRGFPVQRSWMRQKYVEARAPECNSAPQHPMWLWP